MAPDLARSIRENSAKSEPLNMHLDIPLDSGARNKNASMDAGAPDFQRLKLLTTALYIDRDTGTFWLRLLPERK